MKRHTRLVISAVAASLAWLAPARAAAADAVGPGRIELTLDWQANAAFAARVDGALARLQQSLVGRLCHPITDVALAMRPAFCAADPAGAIVHVVVLRDSAFWRIYSTHPAGIEGPLPIGSLAKAVLVVPLLAKAGASADETWCEQALPGLRNADGSTGVTDCAARGPGIGAVRAIAKSNNLATVWRLRRIDTAQLQRELLLAEVRGIPAGVHPAIAATLGIVDLSPRQVLECFDALARAGDARRATIVQHARAAATPLATWCAGAASAAGGAVLVHRLLAAPAQPGGTAAFLPSLLPRASAWHAKTGTPTNDAGHDTAKLLLFSVAYGRATYTALVAIASPRPAWPLAASISSTELRGVANVVATEIAAGSGSRSPSSGNPTKRTPP